jgi:transposase InsO family protein
MDIHQNARTTPLSRAALMMRVNGGELPKTVAAGVGVSDKTVRKWAERFSREGAAGLADRSSLPHRLRRPTAPTLVEQAIALRRQRLLMKHIAAQLELSIATVSRLLKRAGLSRLSALDPPPPIVRYEYAAPGDLLHLDTKKLGRFHRVGSRITGTHQKRSLGAGFEVAHVCIDDHSRLAYAEVLPNERKETTTTFLARALDHFQRLGISVARIMTDNGSAYRSLPIADLCRSRRLRHIFTRPYTPRTNGKAERFIQTALREWAYAQAYPTSDRRAEELPLWIHKYNWHRPHGALKSQTPISRLGLTGDNLLRIHI